MKKIVLNPRGLALCAEAIAKELRNPNIDLDKITTDLHSLNDGLLQPKGYVIKRAWPEGNIGYLAKDALSVYYADNISNAFIFDTLVEADSILNFIVGKDGNGISENICIEHLYVS